MPRRCALPVKTTTHPACSCWCVPALTWRCLVTARHRSPSPPRRGSPISLPSSKVALLELHYGLFASPPLENYCASAASMLFDSNLPLTCFLSSPSAFHSRAFPTSGQCSPLACSPLFYYGRLAAASSSPSLTATLSKIGHGLFASAPFENQCLPVRFPLKHYLHPRPARSRS